MSNQGFKTRRTSKASTLGTSGVFPFVNKSKVMTLWRWSHMISCQVIKIPAFWSQAHPLSLLILWRSWGRGFKILRLILWSPFVILRLVPKETKSAVEPRLLFYFIFFWTTRPEYAQDVQGAFYSLHTWDHKVSTLLLVLGKEASKWEYSASPKGIKHSGSPPFRCRTILIDLNPVSDWELPLRNNLEC